MRYGKNHKTETHVKIVKHASTQLREKGTRGVGVASLMKQAGLTHGGFYAHFGSREDLVIEAIVDAMDQATERWSKLIYDKPADQRFVALIDSYLSVEHRDGPGSGCAVASLAVDIARESPKIRRVFINKLEELIAVFVARSPDRSRVAARKAVISALNTLVGTILLARVAGKTAFSTEILDAGKSAALGKRTNIKRGQKRSPRKHTIGKKAGQKGKRSRVA